MEYFHEGKMITDKELDKIIASLINNPLSRVEKTLELAEGDKVLDIGCYIGYMSYLLAKKHKEVTGIDILSHNIQIAEEKFKLSNLRFMVMEAENLSFPNETFDCIILTEVIEHIENPMDLLKRIHALLRPDGFLIISTPNPISVDTIINLGIVRKFRKQFDKVDIEQKGIGTHVDHIYSWDIFTLYRLLNRSGFKYVRHEFGGFYPPAPLALIGAKSELKFLAPIIGRFASMNILKVQKVADA